MIVIRSSRENCLPEMLVPVKSLLARKDFRD